MQQLFVRILSRSIIVGLGQRGRIIVILRQKKCILNAGGNALDSEASGWILGSKQPSQGSQGRYRDVRDILGTSGTSWGSQGRPGDLRDVLGTSGTSWGPR